MKIIIGLGNPGLEYKNTRHNVGFMVIDVLAEQHDLVWKNNKKFQAKICQNKNFILIKPQTFMNNSGKTALAILSYYKLLPRKFGLFINKNNNLSDVLTVIHDDVDIELGKYKISINSGSAGHQGVQSIINYLKTKKFQRIRIGIRSNLINKITTEKFVLQRFSGEELRVVKKIIIDHLLNLV